MERIRICLSEETLEFLKRLPDKARNKVNRTISLISNGVKDREIFKKLSGFGIWEIRAQCQGNSYRLLAFWDDDSNSLVIVTHGFNKKSQKTPANEIAKAERYRQAYYKNKQ